MSLTTKAKSLDNFNRGPQGPHIQQQQTTHKMSKTTEDQVRKFSRRDAIYTPIVMDAIDKYKLGIDQVDIAEFVRGKIDEIKVTKKHEIVYWVLRRARAYLRYEKERQRLMDTTTNNKRKTMKMKHTFRVEVSADISKLYDIMEALSLVDGVEIGKVFGRIEECKVSPNLSQSRKSPLNDDRAVFSKGPHGHAVLDIDASLERLGVSRAYIQRNSFSKGCLEHRLKQAMSIKEARWSKH